MKDKVYTIDGKSFSNLESFYQEISNKLIPNAEWGRNLDAFDDILQGGFGTPEEGFTLIWENSTLSKEKLGYPETLKWLEYKFIYAHPSHREHLSKEMQDAKEQKGETLFDIIVDIIQSHDDIELQLQ